MNIGESVKLAIDSIRTNKLRASLTLLSISIGVFAIIGVGALTRSFNNKLITEMASLGENAFAIERMPSIQIGFGGSNWRKYRGRKPINFSLYEEFRSRMTSTKLISGSSESSSNIVKGNGNETDPDVTLIGTDEYYFTIKNENLIAGRAFAPHDIEFNRNVAIIGLDPVFELFDGNNPVGEEIIIGNQSFEVIGVLEQKGALLGQSQDNKIIIPLSQFLKYYASRWEENLTISVMAIGRDTFLDTKDEAIGILRGLRDVQPWEENSFEVVTNEAIKTQFSELTGYLSLFGLISGLIALTAAGVGIMNIMLVSVKERTREIGIRKAVGAKKRWILMQFIIETITLSQIGGLIGIFLGIVGAWAIGSLIGFELSLPVDWIIISVVICTILGLISGLYPSWKAANLDPIEALRYE